LRSSCAYPDVGYAYGDAGVGRDAKSDLFKGAKGLLLAWVDSDATIAAF
jgi:hypothetical protein